MHNKALFKRPKRPANPYLLFLRETKDLIKKEKPNCHIKEIVKEIAQRWQNMPFKDKKDYFDRYRPEREKYHEEVKNLKEKHQLIHDQTTLDLKTEDVIVLKRKRGRPRKNKQQSNKVQATSLHIEDLINGEAGESLNKKIKLEINGTISMDLNIFIVDQ